MPDFNNGAKGAPSSPRGQCLAGVKAYMHIDADAFLNLLDFTVVGVKRWMTYGTDHQEGYRVETMVTADRATHPPKEDGEIVTNLYRPLTFKVKSMVKPNVNISVYPGYKLYGQPAPACEAAFRHD